MCFIEVVQNPSATNMYISGERRSYSSGFL